MSNIQYKWTVLTVTTIGVLMAGIDGRIVVIGLPQIAAALGADAEQAIWFTQSYMLGSTIVLLLMGRLSDMFGRVKMYSVGFAIFTIGSGLTSLSLQPTQVILFRVIQGFGSGIIMVNSTALILDATPIKEVGFSLGINMTAFSVGSMAGLTLSGVILAVLDWRALFYINVPIGIFGTLWAIRRLREIGHTEREAPIDWVGFITFTTFIASLLLALTFAAYGMAEQTTVYVLSTISVASLIVFTAYERRIERPLLDLRLLRIREFTGGITAQIISAVAMGAVQLLLSLYLQLGLGLSPFDAGIRIIPFNLAAMAVGAVSGKLSDRYGTLPFTTGGLAMTSFSLYLLSTFDLSTPYSTMVVCFVIMGVSGGLFGSPNMSSIMGSVPPARRGVASAFRSAMFNAGMTVSLNLATLLMTLTVPYTVLTQVISGSPLVTETEKTLFIEGLKKTYLWLTALNAIAIIPSVLRGKRVNEPPHP